MLSNITQIELRPNILLRSLSTQITTPLWALNLTLMGHGGENNRKMIRKERHTLDDSPEIRPTAHVQHLENGQSGQWFVCYAHISSGV